LCAKATSIVTRTARVAKTHPKNIHPAINHSKDVKDCGKTVSNDWIFNEAGPSHEWTRVLQVITESTRVKGCQFGSGITQEGGTKVHPWVTFQDHSVPGIILVIEEGMVKRAVNTAAGSEPSGAAKCAAVRRGNIVTRGVCRIENANLQERINAGCSGLVQGVETTSFQNAPEKVSVVLQPTRWCGPIELLNRNTESEPSV
jgi:hypothetical protein